MNNSQLIGYDENQLESTLYMNSLFGKLKFYQYLQIALKLAQNANVSQLGREEKRSKRVLLKWYYDNFDILRPMIDNIVIEDEDHHFYGVRRDEMHQMIQ